VLIPKGTAIKVKQVTYTDTYTWGKITYKSQKGYVILNKCKYVNGEINGTVYKTRPYLAVTSKSIYIKGQYTLDLRSASGKSVYTTKDSSIATIDSNGVVTGVSAGKTYVYVTNSGVELKCKITVKNPVLSKSELALTKDTTEVLTVKGGDDTISWKSSDKNVAKVKSDGTVVAVAYGTATITAVRNGIKMTCNVTVYDPVLSVTKKNIYVGKTATLKVNQSSGSVTWSSSNKKIAKVNSKGVVTGVATGTATIYAVVDGVKLSCAVKIKEAPTT
jgi:uncharacterized protein YjdB